MADIDRTHHTLPHHLILHRQGVVEVFVVVEEVVVVQGPAGHDPVPQ